MTTQEVANRFYSLAQQGQWEQIQHELFHPKAFSIEPEHAQGLSSVQGIENIQKKGKQWNEMVEEVHGGYCLEPQIAGNYFTCAMGVDATMKGQGRTRMDEIALYEVQEGKIIKEQFFY